mgnify:FL=1
MPGIVAAQEAHAFGICTDSLNAPSPPDLRFGRSAAVLDVETGTLLYEFRSDELWPPASLTKLVTIYSALVAAEEGRFSLREPEPVHPAAYASAVPPGSSLMFLGPNQAVNGEDLLRGLAISSGNDAAVEVALRVSGSVSAFSGRMNQVMQDLGYSSFYFEEPAGLSPANRINAAGFARFAAELVRRWPWVTERLFNLREFTYPEAQHYPAGYHGGAIRQFNRNGMVGSYDGADGLKTGFIDESGYNLAATAQRNGRRLIVVVLGVQAGNHALGGERREYDAVRLMDWAFEQYETVRLQSPRPQMVTVWGGRERSVALSVAPVPAVVVPRGASGAIEGRFDQPEDLWAPLQEGQQVGTVTYHVEGCTVQTVPVTVASSVEEAGAVRRLVDRLRWWWEGQFGDETGARTAAGGSGGSVARAPTAVVQ